MMHKITGGTAKKIREQFPELVEVYWGAAFGVAGLMVKSEGVSLPYW